MNCYIDEVIKPEDGEYIWGVNLTVEDHSSAITVWGEGLDEALERAIIIRDAFKKVKDV